MTVSLPALMRSGSTSASVGNGPIAEQAVLRVQRDVDAGRHVVGDQRRHADAEVDVVAVFQLARDARDDALADIHGDPASTSRQTLQNMLSSCSYPYGRSASRCASRSARPGGCAARRCPGVTTWSGSSSPGSTRCSTSAIVTRRGGRHHRVEVARGLPVDQIADAGRPSTP